VDALTNVVIAMILVVVLATSLTSAAGRCAGGFAHGAAVRGVACLGGLPLAWRDTHSLAAATPAIAAQVKI
jgi:hypothetical protein